MLRGYQRYVGTIGWFSTYINNVVSYATRIQWKSVSCSQTIHPAWCSSASWLTFALKVVISLPFCKLILVPVASSKYQVCLCHLKCLEIKLSSSLVSLFFSLEFWVLPYLVSFSPIRSCCHLHLTLLPVGSGELQPVIQTLLSPRSELVRRRAPEVSKDRRKTIHHIEMSNQYYLCERK